MRDLLTAKPLLLGKRVLTPFFFLLLLLMGGGGLGASDDAAPTPARVLVLIPTTAGLPAIEQILHALREKLLWGSGRPLDLHVETADFTQFPSENYAAIYARFLAEKYQHLGEEHQPEVIVAVLGAAYRFFKEYRETLFPKVPLVFVGLDPSELDAVGRLPQSTGTLADFNITGTLEAALALRPEARRLLAIWGASPAERPAALIKALEDFAGRLEIDYLIGEPPARMREVLGGLPADTIVYYAHFVADQAGGRYLPADVLAAIAPAAAAPIFGVWETYLGRGLVGGHLYSPPLVGLAAGELVLRLLQGESADAIAPVVVPSRWAFDARELARWELNEAALPPGSEVRFRPPDFWSENRTAILGTLTVVILQILLIALLVREYRIRVRAEEQARALGRKLVDAHETERAELARDLHDSLQQQLGFLAMTVGGLEQELARAGVQGTAPALFRERLVRLCGEVRDYAHRLHPPALRDLGLAEALQAECDQLTQTLGVPVRLVADPALAEPPYPVALTLYRIVQEALHNVAKHARAHDVLVTLESWDGGLRLGIRDDGQGFDPARLNPRASLGLFALRERLRAIGGTLEVDSAPGEGSAILAFVPLDRAGLP